MNSKYLFIKLCNQIEQIQNNFTTLQWNESYKSLFSFFKLELFPLTKAITFYALMFASFLVSKLLSFI